MKNYVVRQYYVVEVEVEADSPEEAKEIAGWDEAAYSVTTSYDRHPGGPSITRADLDDEVVEVGDD